MDIKEMDAEAIRAIPLSSLELSARAYNGLYSTGARTAGDIANFSRQELLQLKNYGTKTVTEIEEILGGLGLSLQPYPRMSEDRPVLEFDGRAFRMTLKAIEPGAAPFTCLVVADRVEAAISIAKSQYLFLTEIESVVMVHEGSVFLRSR
jgi:hypothetical protein